MGTAVVPPTAQIGVEASPTFESFAGPDPEAGGDADDETHEVLEHEHGVIGPHAGSGGATSGSGSATSVLVASARDGVFPGFAVILFVE